jgi:hypothetical protein
VSTERYVEPAVGQALEEVRESLRTERRAQEPLSRESAELRERAERLQAERDQLQGDLEHLRQGRTARVPRLPAVLTPPFEVRPPVPLRRQVREALPMLMVATFPLSLAWSKKAAAPVIFLLILGMMVAQFLMHWRARARWRFTQEGLEVKEPEVQGGLVRYPDVVQVEAYSSKGQRLRGVGSVGVTYKGLMGEEKLLTLKDVPEPERLAEWLQSKRPGAR